MCLIDKKKFRFTIFPKICYKTFIFNCNTHQLENFFMHDNVTSRILTPDSNDEPEFESGAYKYTKGFIHAFSLQPFKTTAYYPTLPMNDHIFYTFKCIIPSFTRYAIDIFGKSICARRMIIIDKLAKYVFD